MTIIANRDRADTVSTNSNLSLHTATHPNTKYILSQILFQKMDAAKPQQFCHKECKLRKNNRIQGL